MIMKAKKAMYLRPENDKEAKKATIRKLRRQEVREAAKRKP